MRYQLAYVCLHTGVLFFGEKQQMNVLCAYLKMDVYKFTHFQFMPTDASECNANFQVPNTFAAL